MAIGYTTSVLNCDGIWKGVSWLWVAGVMSIPQFMREIADSQLVVV